MLISLLSQNFDFFFQTQPSISAVTTATCGKHDTTTTTTHSSTTDDDDIIYQPCSHQDELDLVSTFIEYLFARIEKNTFVPYPPSVITRKSFTAFSSQIGDDSSSSHFDPSLFPRLWPANFSEQSTQVCMKLSSILLPASSKKQSAIHM